MLIEHVSDYTSIEIGKKSLSLLFEIHSALLNIEPGQGIMYEDNACKKSIIFLTPIEGQKCPLSSISVIPAYMVDLKFSLADSSYFLDLLNDHDDYVDFRKLLRLTINSSPVSIKYWPSFMEDLRE